MLKVSLEEIKGFIPGQVHTIPRGTTRIGRKDSDIEIPNDRVSATHAEIHYSGTRVILFDRNSTNGTYVNDKRVQRAALKNGDVISIGGPSGKAAAVYRLKIEGDAKKVVYIIHRGIESQFKYFYMIAGLAVVLFFVWLLVPIKGTSDTTLRSGQRPWEQPEDIAIYSVNGIKLTIALGDTVMLPPAGEWKSEVRYEIARDDGVYEPRIYTVELWNDAPESEKVVESNITVQRFKSDFSDSVDKERVKNFIWNEDNFLKDNKIKQPFAYSKSKIGVWQWVIWQDTEKFNLYAACVTVRGRILIQGAAFDVFNLKRFFQYVADSYQEGTVDYTEPAPSSD